MSNQIQKKNVKIRKPRTCVLCRKDFPKGTKMYCETDKLDYFNTLYYCLECASKKNKIGPDENDIFANKPKLRN